MRTFDTIRPLMYTGEAARAVLTADEEKVLARKVRACKADIWTAILSDPITLPDSLRLIKAIAARRKSARKKMDLESSGFQALADASALTKGRSRKVDRLAFDVLRTTAVGRLVDYDPCMEVATELLADLEYRERYQRAGGRHDVYVRYLFAIREAWKPYVRHRNRFIEKNIRLVIKISRKFLHFGISHEDLVQEGTFGLERAVGMFDPDRGFKFSTYASWWIRAFIFRHCRDKGRVVRLPVNTQEKMERCFAAAKKLQGEGKSSDLASVAQATGLSTEVVRNMQTMSLEKYHSMDLETREGRKLSELIADPRELAKDVAVNVDIDILREVMRSLPERQQFILRCRFGIDLDSKMTLQEVGRVIGISRERVRQLEAKAMDAMRVGLERRRKRVRAGLPIRS